MREEVVDAYLNATLAPIEVVGGLPPRRLQRVFAYIRENVARDLSVSELAHVVGMSQYYFSKLFKMSTGITPHQYVMRQRVERAQEHLRESRHGPGGNCHPGWVRDAESLHQRVSPPGRRHPQALSGDASGESAACRPIAGATAAGGAEAGNGGLRPSPSHTNNTGATQVAPVCLWPRQCGTIAVAGGRPAASSW